MRAFKFFSLDNQNNLISLSARAHAGICYDRNSSTTAPPWLAELGLHPLAFAEMEAAITFGSLLGNTTTAYLWEVEGPKIENTHEKRIDPTTLSFLWPINKESFAKQIMYSWPDGTIMLESVLPIKLIAELSVWDFIIKCGTIVHLTSQALKLLSDGNNIYKFAVCVSVNPFVLVSLDKSTKWYNLYSKDFVGCGTLSVDLLNEFQTDIYKCKIGNFINIYQTFFVGAIVRPRSESGFTLHCGSCIYSDAVCVSVEPFVLVSRETDMRWQATIKKDDFCIIDRASDSLLEACMNRLEK